MDRKPKARGTTKRAAKKVSKKEKTQSERFIEAARELGVAETGVEFDAALRKVLRARPKPS